MKNRLLTPCNGSKSPQWWRQNGFLPQRGWKQNNCNALAMLENTSLPAGEGEMEGIWLPFASLPLFCYMSNIKALLYLQTLSLSLRDVTWAVAGQGLSEMQQHGPSSPWDQGCCSDTIILKRCLPLLSVGNDSWLTYLCLKAAELWGIKEQCSCQAEASGKLAMHMGSRACVGN